MSQGMLPDSLLWLIWLRFVMIVQQGLSTWVTLELLDLFLDFDTNKIFLLAIFF